jgi:hypothetical protein
VVRLAGLLRNDEWLAQRPLPLPTPCRSVSPGLLNEQNTLELQDEPKEAIALNAGLIWGSVCQGVVRDRGRLTGRIGLAVGRVLGAWPPLRDD